MTEGETFSQNSKKCTTVLKTPIGSAYIQTMDFVVVGHLILIICAIPMLTVHLICKKILIKFCKVKRFEKDNMSKYYRFLKNS